MLTLPLECLAARGRSRDVAEMNCGGKYDPYPLISDEKVSVLLAFLVCVVSFLFMILRFLLTAVDQLNGRGSVANYSAAIC